MVNQKALIGLGVATVVIIAVAFAVQHSRKPVRDFSEQAGPLVADLGDHINDVSRLVVTSANKKIDVTLDNKDGKWVVAEKGGYPADLGKLREYLLKVADARLIEKKTAKPDRYSDLGVSDISDPKAKGIAVDIGGLKEPVSFITGIFNAQSGGTFVRRSHEAQSWLASGNLIPDKSPANWLRKELANIPSDRIASVTITHADGKVLRVFKDKASDPHYTIADLPKGREPSSDFAANGLASVLSELKIDDVASSKDVPVPDKVTEIRYATFDGVIVDAKAWQVGDKHYVAMSASQDNELAQKHVDAELAKEAGEADKAKPEAEKEDSAKPADKDDAKPALDPARDRQQRLAAITAEVEKLNTAFKGWSFVLPGYKVGDINKTMDDLLKPLETKSKSAK
ncbi:MAG TPA: DUF4340 domain-containing protein [Dokdonella sp.]|uniref:DUF4340 domain-containing protein n=1 Tax=Dokdonella sp. TaxID=2291710 RepID=UPI002D7FFE84|nr:DUF4340 domain-containing protein [Dokdonella sp.]HET9032324.1 DUF4340 domain-containing protein [Dokdonella sp.]